ncbi:MAG: TonB-dependent receptor [Burkholderiaceae bacterium]
MRRRMQPGNSWFTLIIATGLLMQWPVHAQEKLEQIDVVGTTPLPGAAAPRSTMPANVQTVTGRQLGEQRSSTLADYLNRNVGGVHLNEAQSNPYQPDMTYRGFVASPLLGNPIGLSVYVDGVRVNESFGDTVLWDLIPSAAIDSTDLIPGSNPVFGLNTLGGALNVRMHSGRSAPGGSLLFEGGSFGRASVQATYGLAADGMDFFVSAESIEEDGWRSQSPSAVRRVFGKLGFTSGNTDGWVSYSLADNSLTGNGLMPESFLRREPRGVYTYPDQTRPDLSFVNTGVTHYLSDTLTLSANAYRRRLDLTTANGDAEFDDGDTPGDVADDAYEAEFRRTHTRQTTTGLGLQLAGDQELVGARHRWAAGMNFDRGDARFSQSEQEGEFTADRGVEPEGDPVLDTDIDGTTRYRSLYLSDTVTLGERLDVTVSGRYTRAEVTIADRSGNEPDLNGSHVFSRFSPSIGATYRLAGAMSVYGGYNEGFRAPTPVELTCADPDDPCALPVAFVADPPLEPVVARTFEAGIRGGGKGISWHAGVFQTNLSDDILFTSTGASQGFFANVPKTRRRGLELSVSGSRSSFDWFAHYSFVRATYGSDVQLFNPVASDADPTQPGTIDVQKGDRLPGMPEHLLKVGVDLKVSSEFTLGTTMNVVVGQFLRGDESNQRERLSGYAVFNLRADYRTRSGWRLFARIDNLFDRDYHTLGAYNRVAFNDASEPLEGVGIGPVERFLSPGAPRSLWLGFEHRF